MDAAELLREWGPLVGAVGVGLLPWVKVWSDRRSGERRDRHDLVKIAQEAASAVIEDLRDEVDRYRARLEEVEREFTDFRRKHDTMIADKDAKIALLEQRISMTEGEVRQWRATAESYARLLDKNGIPHAKPGQPIWEAKDERLLLVSDSAPGVGDD